MHKLSSELMKVFLVFSCLLAFYPVPHTHSAGAEPSDNIKNVLLVFAETPEFLAYQPFTNGFKTAVSYGTEFRCEISYEYLAISRNLSNSGYAASLKNFLLTKYGSAKPDLVVLFGGTGTPFMLEHGAEIFPGIPKILAGTTMAEYADAQIPPDFSLLRTTFDASSAVQAILKIQPGISEVYVVVGNSEPEKATVADWSRELEQTEGKLFIRFLNYMPLPEMLKFVSRLESHSVLLFNTFFQDVEGHTYYPVNVLRRLYQEAKIPIYTTQDVFVGIGSVGGYVASSRLMGEAVGNLVLQIFKGRELPKTFASRATEYVYDWRELSRWGLGKTTLPEDSRVEYREPSIWERYRWPIAGAASVLILQCAYISILLVSRARRTKAEESLRESEAKFRSYVENAPLAVFVVDNKGRILDFNPSAVQLLGYSPAELAGMRINRIHPEEDREFFLQEFAALLNKGHVETEQRVKRADGRIRWVAINAVMISDRLSIGYCQDVTGRKRAEEDRERLEAQLLQAQKLEAVGTLAGGIAHDFNNILAPIIGYAELALHNLPPTSPIRSGQEQILRAALRARDLVKQILAFGRSSPDEQRRPVEISSIVKEALKFLRASLPTSIEIKQRLGTVMARANPTQIHQILMNLCTNAAHAMDEKGILEVGLSRVDLSESNLAQESIVGLEPGPHLKLWVSDTGTGMDKVTLERIFDPFFTTKEIGKGSGLGLSVVDGIVKQHQGTITIQSAPGKGSTFSVYIPAIELSPFENMEIKKPLPKGTEKILLIDDEQALLEMSTAALEGLGYNIVAETESRRAYELFRESPGEFDLVITDCAMPKLTGLDLALAIRKIRPDIPIIICTGFSETLAKTAPHELKLELLLKPYSVNQLSEAVRKVLARQKKPSIS